MDVTDEKSVEHAVNYVLEQAGRVDVVINNAGAGIASSVEDTSIEEARALFELNFFGVHRVCRTLIPHFRKQGSGHTINIGSLGWVVPIPFRAFYSASKAAVTSLSDGLSIELKQFGIGVTRVEPGDYKTGFTDASIMTVQGGQQLIKSSASEPSG